MIILKIQCTQKQCMFIWVLLDDNNLNNSTAFVRLSSERRLYLRRLVVLLFQTSVRKCGRITAHLYGLMYYNVPCTRASAGIAWATLAVSQSRSAGGSVAEALHQEEKKLHQLLQHGCSLVMNHML